MLRRYTLALSFLLAAGSTAQTAWISEIHYDNDGTDQGEFVEILIPANDDPALYQIDFYNGSNGTVYATINGADWVLTDASSGKFIYLVGTTETPGQLTSIQNSTEGIALSRDGTLLEFLSYEGTFDGVGGPADGVTSTDIGVAESALTPAGASLQRQRIAGFAFGTWCSGFVNNPGDINARDWGPETRGAPNDASGCLYVETNVGVYSPATSAAPGWRLLSVGRTTVDRLAADNLVSGIPDYDVGTNCSIVNLYTGYAGNPSVGNGGYTAPASGSAFTGAGAGLFWYFFGDSPASGFPSSCGTGVSGDPVSSTQSLPLTLTERIIAASTGGTFFDDDVPYTVADADDADGFYLLGNPFMAGFDLSGLTADNIALQAAVSVWDPQTQTYDVVLEVPQAAPAGSYDTVFNPGDGDDLSIYQGFFAERFGADPGADVTFTFDEFAQQSAFETLTARRRSMSAVALGFEVTNGDVTGKAAMLRFADGAHDGWDRFDLSKLGSLSARFALVGPVGVGQDGAETVKAIESRALDLADRVEVPVHFSTSEAEGPFTLSWPTFSLPADWRATLLDGHTGESIDLTPGGAYDFEHRADAAEARFTVTVSRLATDAASAPDAALSVSAPMPNPSADGAVVTVTSAFGQRVRAEVLDVRGRRVAVAFDGTLAGGDARDVAVDTGALAPGVYLIRVTGDASVETRRLVVAR